MKTIFDVIDTLRTALLPTGLTIYRDVKPESQTGACIVLTYMPRKKTNYNSINDIIILLYLPKINGMADSKNIKTYCNQIAGIVGPLKDTGVIFYNELLEPDTINVSTNYTVTKYQFYTINY